MNHTCSRAKRVRLEDIASDLPDRRFWPAAGAWEGQTIRKWLLRAWAKMAVWDC